MRFLLLVSALAAFPTGDALRSEPERPKLRVARAANAAHHHHHHHHDHDHNQAGLKEAYVFMSYGGEKAHTLELMTVIYNLREFDKTRDIVVITPPPAPKQMKQKLMKLNAKVLEMPSVGAPKFCASSLPTSKARLLNSFFKLNIWKLTQYDALLYLESDMLIRKPLDKIFLKFRSMVAKDAVMIATKGANECPEGDFQPTHTSGIWNTGIMAIRPNSKFAQTYLAWVQGTRGNFSCGDGSQALENKLFEHYLQRPYSFGSHPHLVCLPLRYNCKNSFCVEDAAVVHWSGERKPWNGGNNFEDCVPEWEEKRKKTAKAAGIATMQRGTDTLCRQLVSDWVSRRTKAMELMSAPDPDDEGKGQETHLSLEHQG